MTKFLPPHLMMLFAPRPQLAYVPPVEHKAPAPLTGVSAFLKEFCTPEQEPPLPPPFLPPEEKRKLKKKLRAEREQALIEKTMSSWDASANKASTGDAYKTLFVGRLAFGVDEKTLKSEFERFGPIKKLRIIYTPEGKPRGYAFIEYEREKDMKRAYHDSDGRKIMGRRVVVDVERGRTVKGWKPRRFGGGLGSTRKEGARSTASGREGATYRSSSSRSGSSYDRDRSSSSYRGNDRRGGDRDRGYRGGDRSRSYRGGSDHRGGEGSATGSNRSALGQRYNPYRRSDRDSRSDSRSSYRSSRDRR